MQKETLLYLALATTVVCLTCAATVRAADLSATPNRAPALQDDEQKLDPVEKNRKYYASRRYALQGELRRLDADENGDPAKDERRAKLVDELIQACRGLAFADDVHSIDRQNSLEHCAQLLLERRDVATLEALKNEVEAADWQERERRQCVHNLNAFLIKTKIAKAIDEKDAQTLENILPELARLAIDEGELDDAPAYREPAPFVAPIEAFDAKLGAKAKLTMRRGFYLSKRYSYKPELDVEYKPEPVTLAVKDVALSYDKSLLDVPQYETTRFYEKRIADLQNVLSKIPENADADEFKRLRADVRSAIMECYEQTPFAVDLISRVGGPSQAQRRDVEIKKACEKLADAGETARLDRLAEHEDVRDLVQEYRLQATASKAILSNDESETAAAIDALIQWALENPDSVAVAAALKETFKSLQTATVAEAQKAKIETVKSQLRDAFKNAENPAKRRLAYLDALQ